MREFWGKVSKTQVRIYYTILSNSTMGSKEQLAAKAYFLYEQTMKKVCLWMRIWFSGRLTFSGGDGWGGRKRAWRTWQRQLRQAEPQGPQLRPHPRAPHQGTSTFAWFIFMFGSSESYIYIFFFFFLDVFVGFSEPVHQHLRLRIVCETHSSIYLNFSLFGSLDWRAPALRKASKLFG